MSKHTQCLRLEEMDRTKYSRMLPRGWFYKTKELLNQLSKDSSITMGQLQQEGEGVVTKNFVGGGVARFCASQIIFKEMTGNKNKN
jgi:hypothetical protein